MLSLKLINLTQHNNILNKKKENPQTKKRENTLNGFVFTYQAVQTGFIKFTAKINHKYVKKYAMIVKVYKVFE